MSNKLYDFNNASRQRSGFEPIPAGTLVNVQLILRMHLDTPDGWLRRSKDGLSASLDAEFEVLDGEYAKRKFWQLFMITGTTPGHAESIDIARGTLRAIVESAKGIRPDDQSEGAEKARSINDWGDLHGLCFMARVKVKAASGDFPAKNLLGMVITPDLQMWRQVEQRPVPSSQPATGNGASSTTASAAPSSAAAPANAAGVPSRPNWAK